MKKNKINEGHYLELMDRLYLQTCVIEDHLSRHPLTNKIKKVQNLINDSGMALAEAYQIVGHEHFKYEKRKERTKKNISRRHKKPKK
jgi:hypothetical protein